MIVEVGYGVPGRARAISGESTRLLTRGLSGG
jgi:hypothetical protein